MAEVISPYASETYLSDLGECASAAVGLAALSNSTALVAGAAGLLGSFLTDVLLMSGVRVVAADRCYATLEGRFSDAPWQGLSLAEVDVSGGIALEENVDYIFHLASNADPARIMGDPVSTIRANVDGTLNLLEWGLTHNCHRLLYVSSGEVYGGGAAGTETLSESDWGPVETLNVRSCYPLAKRMAENACVSFARQHGLESVIVRPSHSYGPVARRSDSRANAQFVARAFAGEDVVLRSVGSQVRSYTYVADTASAMLTALCSGEACRAYNVANRGSTASVTEFAHEVCDQAGVALTHEGYSESELRDQTKIERQVLDPSALEALGWSGRYDLARGISHTLRAMREMGW